MKSIFVFAAHVCAMTSRFAHHIMIRIRFMVLFVMVAQISLANATELGCAAQSHDKNDYVVCRVDPKKAEIRLFHSDQNGKPYGHFGVLNETLEKRGERLVFAMNAGMYHDDRAPVGLFVEGGKTTAPLNTNDGPGNFHMKPNGVFAITGNVASVSVTEKAPTAPDYATQSGPMLLMDDEIHPRFLPKSTSLKRRNGVGVTKTGEVVFVLADTPVRFYDFSVFFRDVLKTPNALYLDGTISRIYAPELGRNDPGVAMGLIIGVVTAN